MDKQNETLNDSSIDTKIDTIEKIDPIYQVDRTKKKKVQGAFAAVLRTPSIKNDDDPSDLELYGLGEIKSKAIDSRVVYQYILNHPVIPRAIDIKLNGMIKQINVGTPYLMSRVEIVRTKADTDGSYYNYCKSLYDDSGGDKTLRQFVKNGYGFGNGQLLGLLNQSNTQFIKYKIKHPIYFGFDKDKIVKPQNGEEIWKVILDKKYKEPVGFRAYREEQSKNIMVPDKRSKLFPSWRVVHLALDRWGDEVEGISMYQYIHRIVLFMMNMETDSALEVKHFGRLKYKFTTSFRNLDDIREYAQVISQILPQDAVILTEGGDCDLLVPKSTGPFASYWDKFLTILAMRTGIPKDILETTGKNSNNAVITSLKEDMIDDLSNDESEISNIIREQMFIPACALLFGGHPIKPNKKFDIKKVPYLMFKIREEDQNKLSTIFLKQSRGFQALANALDKISANSELLGETRTNKLINQMLSFVPQKQLVDIDHEFYEEKEEK